ncbi:MAG: hypothetical protein ACE5R6_08730 [Candidatus Heimdallarchaeota archaeon]
MKLLKLHSKTATLILKFVSRFKGGDLINELNRRCHNAIITVRKIPQHLAI